MTIRPACKIHGGKFYLAKRIVSEMRPHSTYVETHGGMASVLLNKPPSPVEVYNDLDDEVVNFFRVLRDRPEVLIHKLTLTPYAQEEFDAARQADEYQFALESTGTPFTPPDEVELARRFFVLARMSLGGRAESFSYTKHRVRRGMADVVSGYLSAIDQELPKIVERLRRVQIVSMDALDCIRRWDGPNTLFYSDPTYLPSTRTSPKVYRREMTEEQHVALANALNQIQGKAIVSGYPSELYERLYSAWRRQDFDIANHAAGGDEKRRMTEVLWMNY